jgi:hypothetical protein
MIILNITRHNSTAASIYEIVLSVSSFCEMYIIAVTNNNSMECMIIRAVQCRRDIANIVYQPFAEDSLRKRGDECKIILKYCSC